MPTARPHTTVPIAFTALTALTVCAAEAQSLTGTPLAPTPYPDARLVPKGVLRLSFEPEYITYDHLYDSDGNREPLGARFSSDSAGADLFPTAMAAQSAIRSITGLSDYRISIGKVRTTLDADIRRFPFNFRYGLMDRLTLTASVPVVTTRMQAGVALDTAGANAGWNAASTESGGAAAARTALTQLLAQLETGAAFVEGRIAAGDYGCPTSALCDQARDLVTRARTLAAEIETATGVGAGGIVADRPLPPFAPLASSAAGQALLSAVQSVSAELQSFGAAGLTTTIPLPTSRLDTGAVRAVLDNPEFGYDAFPLAFSKYRQRLGDLEIGVRWGVADGPRLRAALVGTVRLPTGTRDSPDHFLDIGTGDRQTDVIGGLEAVWLPGSVVALAVAGSYTVQLANHVTLRLTSPEQPIAPAMLTTSVRRDLGDVLHVSVYPSLRLSDAFTAYGAVHHFRKTADRFSPAGPAAVDPDGADGAFDLSVLATGTALRTLSFGAGVHYSPHGAPGGGLPIQAGIDYRAAFRGSAGRTPMDVRINFYLRLYYRVVRGAGEP